MRAKLLDVLRPQSSEPQVFDDEQVARDAFEKHIGAGMLRVVNLYDDGSIEAAAAELAAFKVQDSAYVSSDHQGDITPGSPGSRDSSTSSSSGRQASSSTSSPQPSTRWSPATRGLASASAFAGGDASALEGILEARDAAEREQALIREEHARRYRQERKTRQRSP